LNPVARRFKDGLPAVLETASAWTVTDLDSGGWDFDARREGATLAVLHRLQPAAFFTGIGRLDPAFAAEAQKQVLTARVAHGANRTDHDESRERRGPWFAA
jgi:hypothetical protein